ncbi:hypothetical protein M0R72_14795 [Candidatus Pacearchaeota archaeon]|jgi:hypothetical protein|nr:hypothetical protein [Candidatus Pacearchaeota archaeon]
MNEDLKQRIVNAPVGSTELLDAITEADSIDLPEVDALLDAKLGFEFAVWGNEAYWKALAGPPNPLHAEFPTQQIVRQINDSIYKEGRASKSKGINNPRIVGNPISIVTDRHQKGGGVLYEDMLEAG